MGKANYKNLIAWQKADNLAYTVYIKTKDFPKEEKYCLTSQLRRAVLSVPINIVEGYARYGKKEFKHFLNISLGSLAEAEYILEFCKRLGYFNNDNYAELQRLRQETGNLLWGLYQSI